MKISDLENNIKIKKRNAKEIIEEAENAYQNYLMSAKSKRVSLILIYFIITIIFVVLPLPFLSTLAPFIVYILALKKYKKEEIKTSQSYANKIALNKIDLEMYEEIIDACVLYKDFLKQKFLSSEDLNKILYYLSPYMVEELFPVYKKLNEQEEISCKEEKSPTLSLPLDFLLMNTITNIQMNLFIIHQNEKEEIKEKVNKIENKFQMLMQSLNEILDEKALLIKIKDFYPLLDATNEIIFEMNQSQTHHLQK